MIRPRVGDFCYNEDEIAVMLCDIKMFKIIGVQGIVIGMLNSDGTVDADLLQRYDIRLLVSIESNAS